MNHRVVEIQADSNNAVNRRAGSFPKILKCNRSKSWPLSEGDNKMILIDELGFLLNADVWTNDPSRALQRALTPIYCAIPRCMKH